MAPSVAELPQTETVPIVVPVKAVQGEEKPKVRRIIEEEGGKTTASVRLYSSSTHTIADMDIVSTLLTNLGPWRKI
jgi:hypothetical protein